MALRLVERSSTPVVPLEEFVAHVRREDTLEDDALLRRFLDAATIWAENFTGLALVDQTWDYYVDAFPTDVRFIKIPRPPLLYIDGVFYRPTSSTSESSFSDYYTDIASQPGQIFLGSAASWPSSVDASASSVRIRFRAGYFDESSSPVEIGKIPEDIKVAIQIYAATLYENREATITGTMISTVPWSAEQLLRMYRVENSMA